MKTQPIDQVEARTIPLARTTEREYGVAVCALRHSGFWWYLRGLVATSKRFRPFADSDGRWWWYVKPGFAWPVDFFSHCDGGRSAPPGRLLLGRQYPVAPDRANAVVRLNVIDDLSTYDLSSIEKRKRRTGIRKALKSLDIAACDPIDRALTDQACDVWNSHVRRTGWNSPMDASSFHDSWRELGSFPGTTVIIARDPAADGVMCGWLITRVIDDTVFIDTIASHTDRMAQRPNDAMIFRALVSAAAMGVAHGHYALQSRLESLEAFKQALGFHAHPFPSRLELRWPVAPLLRLARPRLYRRLLGEEGWYRGPGDSPAHAAP